MKAAVVHGPNVIRVEELPDPTIGDYEALVQITACGVCTGTDLHILQGSFPRSPAYPFVLGHESIGRVLAVGPKVRYLKPGDQVLRPLAIRRGERVAGVGMAFGGFAEKGIVVDARAMVESTPRTETPRLPAFAVAQQVVPPDFDPVDAGMFITFKETLSWMHDLGPVLGRCVVVLGTGPVGLCFVRIAKYLGADPVVAVGRRDERLELARQMGADGVVNTARQEINAGVRELTGGRGADYVVEAVGSDELLREGLRALADGGQLAIYGISPGAATSFDHAGLPSNWQVRLIRPREELVHDLALDLIRLGFVDLRAFVKHVLPLSRVEEALRLVVERQTLKPVVTMGGARR